MIATRIIQQAVLFCTDCGLALNGIGSKLNPYKCQCGTWERPTADKWVLNKGEDNE